MTQTPANGSPQTLSNITSPTLDVGLPYDHGYTYNLATQTLTSVAPVGGYTWSPNSHPIDGSQAYWNGVGFSDDAPGVAIPVGGSAEGSGQMITYLMFNPGATNSVYVPIQELIWSFDAAGSANGLTKTVYNSGSLASIDSLNDFPVWTGTVTNN